MPILPGAARARSGTFLSRHRAFTAALCAAAALRVIAELGYRWAIWFNDSYDYVANALHPSPDSVRPSGYPLLLWLLKPFHSLALVTIGQHLLGLGGAVLLYVLLRRRFGLPGWGATLAAIPLLFDAYQIQLEHLLLSDTLAEFLLIAAVVLTVWSWPGRAGSGRAIIGAPSPGRGPTSHPGRWPWWSPAGGGPSGEQRRPRGVVLAAAASGLLFAAAALTRTAALPLLIVGIGYLAVSRADWRAITAAAAAAAAPLAGYALWFHSAHGAYALSSSDGVFLWARTAAFAECGKIKPPRDEAWLCPRLPPARRAASSSQMWQPDSPLDWQRGQVFSLSENAAARRFALRAIAAQPGDYARTVTAGAGRTFGWGRAPYPTSYTADLYKFSGTKTALLDWPVTVAGSSKPTTTVAVARAYAGRHPATVVVQPYAGLMRWYQRYVYLRGTLLGIILLITPAAMAVAWLRSRRETSRGGSDGSSSGGTHSPPGPTWYCWAVAVTLILIPPMTHDFDYRYVLPAVPFGCAAAALAVVRLRAGPTRRSPGGPAAVNIRTVREFTATDD